MQVKEQIYLQLPQKIMETFLITDYYTGKLITQKEFPSVFLAWEESERILKQARLEKRIHNNLHLVVGSNWRSLNKDKRLDEFDLGQAMVDTLRSKEQN